MSGDRLAAARDGARGGINDHVADLQPGLGLAGGAADEGAQPRQQFRQLEGFDEVIVRAGVQAPHAVANGIARGEHQHGGLLGLAQPPQQFPAVHARQHDVEDDGVVVVALGLVEALLAVRGAVHGVAVLAQGLQSGCPAGRVHLRLPALS